MKINDLHDLRYFMAVYQANSFTSAAAKLQVSKVAVSKRISQLEHSLGHRLFLRNTKGIAPTPEANHLYAQSLELFLHVDRFENSLTSQGPLSGLVRITCPSSMATAFIGELLVDFQHSFPGIRYELISTDSVLDLVDHNVDLAIRMGNTRSSSLVGRKLGDNELVFCASPKYLEQAPVLRSPADLKKHPVFYMDYHGTAHFLKNDKTIKELLGPSPLSTNDGIVVKSIGLASQGVVVRSRWSVKKELASGELVQVLERFPLEAMGPIWLFSTSGRMQAARVRAVFDMLVEKAGQYL